MSRYKKDMCTYDGKSRAVTYCNNYGTDDCPRTCNLAKQKDLEERATDHLWNKHENRND